MITLPPLPVILPPLPMPVLPPLTKPSREFHQVQTTQDYVQVITEYPDDEFVRVAFVQNGVDLHAGSMLPLLGAVYMFQDTKGRYVYRHRK